MNTNWHPLSKLRARNVTPGDVLIWPQQLHAQDCIRIFTNFRFILASKYAGLGPGNEYYHPLPRLTATPRILRQKPLRNRVVHIWTDGSAVNNGSHLCVSAAAWVSDTGHSDYRRLVGSPSSNNVAEITAAALALHSWQYEDIHIHTDSKLVLELLNGRLLGMEEDGWMSSPWVKFEAAKPPGSHSNLTQFLLYFARSHQGSLEVSWTKSHADDKFNNKVDELAKSALTGDKEVNAFDFCVPSGWVDTSPTLGRQSLKFLTACVVRDTTAPPFSSDRCAPFIRSWSAHILTNFGHLLDAGPHGPRLWIINIPSGLRELLWKHITGSLPLGESWYGDMALGRTCRCGTSLSLDHMWQGCSKYDMSPLLDILSCFIRGLTPDRGVLTVTEDPLKWGGGCLWSPLLALKTL